MVEPNKISSVDIVLGHKLECEPMKMEDYFIERNILAMSFGSNQTFYAETNIIGDISHNRRRLKIFIIGISIPAEYAGSNQSLSVKSDFRNDTSFSEVKDSFTCNPRKNSL